MDHAIPMQWADASVEQLVLTYEGVTIRILDSLDRRVAVHCRLHILAKWDGHWDENIVESGTILKDDPVIDRVLHDIRSRHGDAARKGGGERRLDGPWYLLRITFLDGARIDVVAQDLHFEVEHNN